MRIYVGTYTGTGSQGIYLLRFDEKTGNLTDTGIRTMLEHPSFLALHPSGTHLYAVSELAVFDGRPTGLVCAYSIDPLDGSLSKLNHRDSEGTYPCHVVVDNTGSFVMVSNYGSGTVSVFPILQDGSLGETLQILRHEGSSINEQRQKAPHAHSVTLSQDDPFAYICDLGTDRIMIYRMDPIKKQISPGDPPSLRVSPGSGPRHFAFHPRLPLAYVIHELSNTVSVFSRLPSGGLDTIQTLSTLPNAWQGISSCADIHVHPSGNFLYGSNRGHDSIVGYALDAHSGAMKILGHHASGGKCPRNFSISPSGDFMWVANQESDRIVVFRIDLDTGELTETGSTIEIPKPVCILAHP